MKKGMKIVLRTLIVHMSLVGVAYISAAFSMWDLNAANWPSITRFMVLLISGMISVAVNLSLFIHEE